MIRGGRRRVVGGWIGRQVKRDRGVRTGEKLGWIGGWAGAFCSIPVGLGIGAAVVCSPWSYPRPRYWRLMVAAYLFLMASLLWATRLSGYRTAR